MKKNIKSKLDDIINVLGYISGIGLAVANGWVFCQIWDKGKLPIPPNIRESSNIILALELLGMSGIATFLGYKLGKTFKDKYKL